MSNPVKLSDIADIKLGQTFRGRAEASDASGYVKLVQIKDIQEGFISSAESLPYANLEAIKLKVELQKDDLLLPLRGTRYEAAIFDAEPNGQKVTTTNQIAIIRPRTEMVRLKFLLCYFNSDIGRDSLKSITSGTTIPSIKSNDLASLPINVPDFEIQDTIIAIYLNWQRQKSVLSQLLENGDSITNRLCRSIMQEEK